MKSLIVALMLVSGSAMAQSDLNAYRSQDDFSVTYLSWCEKNNVMAQDSQGNVYVRANCSDQGLTCKAVSSYRGNSTVYAAACSEK